MNLIRSFGLCAASIALCSPLLAQQSLGQIGDAVADFELQDVEGRVRSLSDVEEDLVVVIFTGVECPLARLYAPRLVELHERFADRSVSWLAINSNQQDSLAELQHFFRSTELSFPLLKDPGNTVADQFAAKRTPEAFVLDKTRRVRYRGRIDDQYTYGLARPDANENHLAVAIEELLAGQEVSVPETKTVGCIIGRVFRSNENSTVTYSNQISRILQDNCASCHRPGEIGPFALTEYAEVVGWAGMIQEVVNEGRMPPWHANPEHGQFLNDVRLTAEEKQLINQWVEQGAPQGDPADLPAPRTFFAGWQMGEPDLIIPMSQRPFSVPATGVVEYQYFEVDPGFEEDKWVSAAECRLGNRAVIHHIIVGIRGEGEFGRGVHDQAQSDWIVATAPGSPPMTLPEGHAKRIPAGSKLIFQMHYTPNGVPQTDISSVGFRFIDPSQVTHQVVTLKAIEEDFRIPPGAENHLVSARFRFRQDAQLLTLFPHMHLRGKSFRYTAHYPDGREEILLDVPAYDFNWQNAYKLVKPKLMPAGTRLVCLASFDNSENNLANPNPSVTVRWGDQTWEEMMIGYFNIALPRE